MRLLEDALSSIVWLAGAVPVDRHPVPIERIHADHERAGASVTHIRAVDHDIALGMSPDMSEVDPDGGSVAVDRWPAIEQLSGNCVVPSGRV